MFSIDWRTALTIAYFVLKVAGEVVRHSDSTSPVPTIDAPPGATTSIPKKSWGISEYVSASSIWYWVVYTFPETVRLGWSMYFYRENQRVAAEEKFLDREWKSKMANSVGNLSHIGDGISRLVYLAERSAEREEALRAVVVTLQDDLKAVKKDNRILAREVNQGETEKTHNTAIDQRLTTTEADNKILKGRVDNLESTVEQVQHDSSQGLKDLIVEAVASGVEQGIKAALELTTKSEEASRRHMIQNLRRVEKKLDELKSEGEYNTTSAISSVRHYHMEQMAQLDRITEKLIPEGETSDWESDSVTTLDDWQDTARGWGEDLAGDLLEMKDSGGDSGWASTTGLGWGDCNPVEQDVMTGWGEGREISL
ncbi:hypothetical protein B0T20DRAFT_477455 [Sordaria brevicollis]|uniref:Uncharacterized protein n=1 Tax=Sordaria brevicollis TaxID=83679 RepID=A0AAE0PHI8_SORBR|nr:hypothetical protein B0T20DRAFT_477455 [Sordaria brevicollis]